LRIFFKSFGPIRRTTGATVIELDVKESSTIRDVIQRVIDLYGEQFSRLVIDNGKVSGNLILLLNGRDTQRLDGLNTIVSQDDEVTILPHVQGGCVN
jgi:molybdopterin synthase sulfur carrier subunit